MIVHAIFDFSYLYYKYKFAVASGNMKRLSCPVNWKGAVIEKDISIIYYAIREIEKQRRDIEDKGFSVVSSVCFDMPSVRKEMAGGEEYKSGRGNKLDQKDFEDIQFIEKLLSEAGHNTYRYEGYEADDIVTYLAQNFNDVYDLTLIFTPDKDLFVNIGEKVRVNRHKVSAGYSIVGVPNYEAYLTAEFGCRVPYNAILLFLSTVGDKADKIKGINKFGPKAFDKMVAYLESRDIDWTKCVDTNYMKNGVFPVLKEYLKPEQYDEMIQSYGLVEPRELDFIPPAPIKKTTYETRVKAYSPYKFTSLYQ